MRLCVVSTELCVYPVCLRPFGFKFQAGPFEYLSAARWSTPLRACYVGSIGALEFPSMSECLCFQPFAFSFSTIPPILAIQ